MQLIEVINSVGNSKEIFINAFIDERRSCHKMEALSAVITGCKTYPLRSSRCRSSSTALFDDDVDDKIDDAEEDERIPLVEEGNVPAICCCAESEI